MRGRNERGGNARDLDPRALGGHLSKAEGRKYGLTRTVSLIAEQLLEGRFNPVNENAKSPEGPKRNVRDVLADL